MLFWCDLCDGPRTGAAAATESEEEEAGAGAGAEAAESGSGAKAEAEAGWRCCAPFILFTYNFYNIKQLYLK